MQGLLADVELRPLVGPVTSHTYDWMHTYLSNGICSLELYNCVQACKDNGFHDFCPTMLEYCKSTWCFPGEHSAEGRQVHTQFCKAREAASKDHWRSSASEMLTAYPLIRHFAEQIMSVAFPVLQEHVASLVLSFRVLDILQDTKGGTINVALLQKAIVEHLENIALCLGRWICCRSTISLCTSRNKLRGTRL